jgi:hypothetical protein
VLGVWKRNGSIDIGNIGALVIGTSGITFPDGTFQTTAWRPQDIVFVSNTTPSTSNTTGALVVAGGVGIGGTLYGNTIVGQLAYQSNTGLIQIPSVLSDISNQFDTTKCVFNLLLDQSNVTSIMDSKNLEVVLNGARLSPYIKELGYPWINTYDSFKGYRVVSTNTSSQLIIYNAPDYGDQAILTLINSSSSKQTKKYPYSAATIALGD